jgi:hypothetical protein
MIRYIILILFTLTVSVSVSQTHRPYLYILSSPEAEGGTVRPVRYEATAVTRTEIDFNFDNKALVWYDFTDATLLNLKGDTILTAYNKIDITSADSINADIPEYAPLFNPSLGAVFTYTRSEEMYDAVFTHETPLTLYLIMSSDETYKDSGPDIFNDFIGDYYLRKLYVDPHSAITTKGLTTRYKTEAGKTFYVIYTITPTKEYLTVNMVHDSTLNFGGDLEGLNLGYMSSAVDDIKIKEFAVRDGADSEGDKERLINEMVSRYSIDTTEPHYLKRRNVGILGNSILSEYGAYGFNSVAYYMKEYNYTFSDISVSGANISDQRTSWEGLTADARSKMNFVIINEGLVDLDPSESASATLDRYQILIDSVNSDISASCKVIILTMTPNKSRLITLYGAVDGLVAYQKWLDMNTAIMGSGPDAITGVDYRVDSHQVEMNDGAGNLKAEYDGGDGIHENELGRIFIADLLETIIY